jgi:hypothetical protein
MLKTNFGIHLGFQRHFEFLKKVYFYKSLVKNSKKKERKKAFGKRRISVDAVSKTRCIFLF